MHCKNCSQTLNNERKPFYSGSLKTNISVRETRQLFCFIGPSQVGYTNVYGNIIEEANNAHYRVALLYWNLLGRNRYNLITDKGHNDRANNGRVKLT